MNSYGAMFFNPNLFVINGMPMNFFLDGYDNHEVNEMARIIEAFGGKLAMPGEETIIFSEPGRPATTNHGRFHIQCLHDSIVARQFQDLEQYRIPLIKSEIFDNELSPQSTILEQNESPHILEPLPGGSPVKPWKIVSVSSYANEKLPHSFHSADSKTDFATGSWTADADSETSEDSNKRVVRLKRHSRNGRRMNGQMLSSTMIENATVGHSFATKRKRTDDSESSDSSSASKNDLNKRRRSYRSKRKWSEEEDKRLIQCIIDNDAMARTGSGITWRELEEQHIFTHPYRSGNALRNRFLGTLRHKLSTYIEDPGILKKFKEYLPSSN